MKEATQVAGFKKWQSMGRKLKKGVHGIQIIYPIKRKYTKIIEGQDSLLNDDSTNNKNDTLILLSYTFFKEMYRARSKNYVLHTSPLLMARE